MTVGLSPHCLWEWCWPQSICFAWALYDSLRAVNALLIALDSLHNRPNVAVLCTSNLIKAMDPAFLDRVDDKLHIPEPGAEARYEIFRTQVMMMHIFGRPGKIAVLCIICRVCQRSHLQYIACLARSFTSPQTSRPLKSRRKLARSPCPLQSRSLDLGKLVYREARCMTRTLFPVAVSMSRAGGTRSPSIATMKTRCMCNNMKVPLS